MWRGPDHEGDFPTLGWLLLDWWADYLPSPTDQDSPLIFTDEQAQILLEWYRIDPRTGRYVYRRGASRRSKGWGKSPVEGAKAIAALAGPIVFAGWDADGQPVGRPRGTVAGEDKPWIQIAAVSEDQTDNTYSTVYEFLTANEARAADELRIDVGLTRCNLIDRPGQLEPVTAAAGSREGQRVTDAVLDETHLWLPSNGGVKLARTLRRNVAKMGGRSYETTNSFVPGEKSVAEGTHVAAEKGEPGIFYDAVEAPLVAVTDTDAQLRAALTVAYGGAHWVDLDRLLLEIRDPETPWEDSQRFYFNHNVDDRLKAVEKKAWDDLTNADVGDIPAGARVGLGFDGSISGDATALIGCTLLGGVPHTFEIAVWQRPPGAPKEWRIPRRDVQDKVAETFEVFDVGLMLCDPPKWHSEIEAWAEEYGEERVLFFDTNVTTRMAKACDRFLTQVAEGKGAYSHDGAETLSAHVIAMHKKKVRIRDEDDDGRTKFVFIKGPDRLKIDAGIGAVLALEAAMTMPAATALALPLVTWR